MRTGDVKEIRLKGLTSAQNDYECADGEMQVCHNAVNTGNGLRPVQQAETLAELPAGWVGVVFVHHTSEGDIYIAVDGSGNAWWYKDSPDGREEITEPDTGLFQNGGYSVTSVGNVLVVNFTSGDTDATGLNYYRWVESEGTYKYMGQAPPDVKLEFAAIHYNGSIQENGNVLKRDSYVTQTASDNVTVKFRSDLQFTKGSMLSYEEAFDDYPEWLNHILGRVNAIKAEMRRQGLFMEKFFVRTAYRLYDGTYIMQSAPVLVAPSMEDNPMIWPYKINADLKEDTGGKYWELSVQSKILYRTFVLGAKSTASGEEKNRLKDWQDVIDRICVFITPQMQSYTEDPKHMLLVRKEKIPVYSTGSVPGTVTSEDKTVIDGTDIDSLTEGIDRETWKKGAYRAYLTDGFYTGTITSKRYSPPREGNYGGDIEDKNYTLESSHNADEQDDGAAVMDVEGFNLQTGMESGNLTATLYNNQYLKIAYQAMPPEITDQTERDLYIRLLTEFGGFHHVIKFEQKPDTAEQQAEQQYIFYPLVEYTIDEAVALGDSANADGSTMEWPYLSMNNSSTMWPRKGEEIQAPAGMSFVKFPKDTLETLTARTDTLTDDYNSWQNTMPDITHTYNGRLNVADLRITFRDAPWTWMGGQTMNEGAADRMEGQVVIETDGATVKAALPESYYRLGVNCGYFYYPHPDAKRIEILSVPLSSSSSCVLYKIELKTHPYLHGAYFFDEDFDLNEYATAYSSEEAARNAMTVADGEIRHPNYMYTSEVDNPFFFPAQGVNAIGTGKIVALKNASKAISEGTAFGAAPLYAFCTDGIWPLTVGTTGLFAATNPPSRETLQNNDPNAAIQTDNAVIFLSDKGLMQLVGESTTLLSGDLTEKFSTFDVDDLPGWESISRKFGETEYLEADDFIGYIKSGARLAFDYENYRIIIFKPYVPGDADTHVAFMYDIVSKMWTTIENMLYSSVEGYPASLVNMQGPGGVTAVGQFGGGGETLTGGGKVIYTTRPMKLDKPDVLKTVRTLIERSISHGGTKYLALWGSRDMVNWAMIGAVNGARMPRLSGTPYKYLIAGGWSVLDIHGDAISRLTIESANKYTDKLR